MRVDEATLIVEGCLLMIINTIAVYVVVRLNRKTFNNILIGLLFLSHILAGLLNILSTVFEVERRIDLHLQVLTTLYFFTAIEVGFTITISMERYIAIRKPFLHQRLNKVHGACAITAAPLGASVFLVCRHFSATAYLVGFSLIIAGAVLVTVSNIYLYSTVKRQCTRIKSLTKANSRQEETLKKAYVTQRRLRSMKICLLISVSYIFTWVPLAIYMLLRKTIDGIVLTLFPDVLAYSNGIWDVVIFFYLNKTARRHLSKILRLDGVVKSASKWKSSIRLSSFTERKSNKIQPSTCDKM